ncbi:uncharacterized protein LOC131937067 [Physella acuta]|uniref:uncharacterized protein LOC131937067 n=1 Tax=Physella acuta TaxID=109671 RepID=UPI0027DE5B8B|nr:uncharacterized protein LOC131937067 [Physella acuta]
MASTTLLLICLAVGVGLDNGQDISAIPSEKVIRFLHSLSGFFSGERQLSEEKEKNSLHQHSLVEVYYIPIDVQIFHPIPTFYMQQFVNKVTTKRHIVTVTEDDDGLIHVTPYNVTVDVSFHRNGSLDHDGVYRLRRKDVSTHPNCVAVYAEMEHAVFFGSWPDCEISLDLDNPKYSNLLTCHYTSSLVSHPGAKEGANPVPFVANKAHRELLPYMMYGRPNLESSCGPTPPGRKIEWPST